MPQRWWLFNDQLPPKERNVGVDWRGDIPIGLAELRGLAAIGVYPSSAPPGWMDGNIPASGNWMNVPVAYLASPLEKTQLALKPIGPVNEDMSRSAALQAALADTLRKGQ